MSQAGERDATMTWTVHREVAVLIAWGPAVLLQFAHPLIAQGVADHSTFRTQRWGRVRRLHATLNAMLDLCFGSEDEGRAAIARINAIHDRVYGRLPRAAGRFAIGTGYSAHDPTLLAWVHATLLEMNLRVYELFVGSLPIEAKDRYCAEAAAIELPLGISEGRLPRTFAELQRYSTTMLASGELAVGDVARDLARALLYPPVPLIARPGIWWTRLVTIGLLDPAIRAAYGFSWDRRKERLLRGSARVIRTLLPLAPSVIRHWPAARSRRHAAGPSGCPFAAANVGEGIAVKSR